MTKTIKKLKIKLHYDASYLHTKPTKMKYKHKVLIKSSSIIPGLGEKSSISISRMFSITQHKYMHN